MGTESSVGNISPRAATELFVTDILVGNDVDALDDLATERVTMHFLGADRKVVGRENLKAMLATAAEPFSDVEYHVEDVIEGEDRVVVRALVTGTQTDAFVSETGDRFPGSGKDFEMSSILICRFEDGKIDEIWRLGATMQLVQQLGWLPNSPGQMVRFAAGQAKHRDTDRRRHYS